MKKSLIAGGLTAALAAGVFGITAAPANAAACNPVFEVCDWTTNAGAGGVGYIAPALVVSGSPAHSTLSAALRLTVETGVVPPMADIVWTATSGHSLEILNTGVTTFAFPPTSSEPAGTTEYNYWIIYNRDTEIANTVTVGYTLAGVPGSLTNTSGIPESWNDTLAWRYGNTSQAIPNYTTGRIEYSTFLPQLATDSYGAEYYLDGIKIPESGGYAPVFPRVAPSRSVHSTKAIALLNPPVVNDSGPGSTRISTMDSPAYVLIMSTLPTVGDHTIYGCWIDRPICSAPRAFTITATPPVTPPVIPPVIPPVTPPVTPPVVTVVPDSVTPAAPAAEPAPVPAEIVTGTVTGTVPVVVEVVVPSKPHRTMRRIAAVVPFPLYSPVLTPKAKRILDRAVAGLMPGEISQLTVEGSIGSWTVKPTNGKFYTLDRKRAVAVRDYLADVHGITAPAASLSTLGRQNWRPAQRIESIAIGRYATLMVEVF